MVAGMKEVGPNRYRESYGRYYEDFTIGDTYEHRPGRTITPSTSSGCIRLPSYSAGRVKLKGA